MLPYFWHIGPTNAPFIPHLETLSYMDVLPVAAFPNDMPLSSFFFTSSTQARASSMGECPLDSSFVIETGLSAAELVGVVPWARVS